MSEDAWPKRRSPRRVHLQRSKEIPLSSGRSLRSCRRRGQSDSDGRSSVAYGLKEAVELSMVWVPCAEVIRMDPEEHVSRIGVRERAEPLLGGVGPQLSAFDRVERRAAAGR